MLKGFKNFLMRGDVITVAVGLVVALAFSNLVESFTKTVVNPLVAAAQPNSTSGLGVQLGAAGAEATFLNVGSFISAIIYFVVFMAVVYFAIVVPYKHIQARRGVTVFGEEAPEPATKVCPECLSDIPAAARKCKYCASLQT
jgi:large conductance mechanosensitive channel